MDALLLSLCRSEIRRHLNALSRIAFAAALFGLLIMQIPAPTARASMIGRGVFGSYERRSEDISKFRHWISFKRRSETEQYLENDLCTMEGGSWCTLKKWRNFLQSIRTLNSINQLKAVNRFVNAVPYISDIRNYQNVDHWATPRQFFARGGDCEDYALTKYLSLRALGWAKDKLRLAVVIDKLKRQAHALLIVYHNDTILILDNQNREVVDSRHIKRYRPIYSINDSHWWYHMPKPSS